MATWLAGQTMTAARASQDSDDTGLSDTTTFTAAGGFEQWGTEEVTFTNPGIAVKVKAWLSGRLVNTVDADSTAVVRVGISFDGGSTFTYGSAPQVNVGTAGSARTYVGALHLRDGTPTGSVVIRAEVDVSDADVDGLSGHLMAEIIPQ